MQNLESLLYMLLAAKNFSHTEAFPALWRFAGTLKCHGGAHGSAPVSSPLMTCCRYEWVWALKRDFPHLQFSLNGGVMGCYEAAAAIRHREPTMGNPSTDQAAANGPLYEAYSNGHAESRLQHGILNSSPQLEVPHQGDSGSKGHAEMDAEQSRTAQCQQEEQHSGAKLAESDGAERQGGWEDGTGEGGLCGVMIGRAAYNSPWECLSDADKAVFGASSNPAQSRRQVCASFPRISVR